MGKKPKYGQQVVHRQTGTRGKITGISRGTIRVQTKNGTHTGYPGSWAPSTNCFSCSVIVLAAVTIPAGLGLGVGIVF